PLPRRRSFHREGHLSFGHGSELMRITTSSEGAVYLPSASLSGFGALTGALRVKFQRHMRPTTPLTSILSPQAGRGDGVSRAQSRAPVISSAIRSALWDRLLVLCR